MFEEIAYLLNVEEATTSTPGWLPMRLPAIKRVFDSMTEEERAELYAEREKMMRQGYSEQKKRRYVNADADADSELATGVTVWPRRTCVSVWRRAQDSSGWRWGSCR